MARDDQGWVIIAGPEFKAVADSLRDMDASLPTALRKSMKDAAQPVLLDVRNAARELPAYGFKHTGLRARLAGGVSVQTGVGLNARMRFVTKMPPGQEELPRGEDAGIRGWRHPVYGHMDTWVHQDGGSWFVPVIANHKQEILDRLQEILDQAADAVDDAGKV